MTTPADDARRRVRQSSTPFAGGDRSAGDGPDAVARGPRRYSVENGRAHADAVVLVTADDARAAHVPRPRWRQRPLPRPSAAHQMPARVMTVLDLARWVLDDHASTCGADRAPGTSSSTAAGDQNDFDDRCGPLRRRSLRGRQRPSALVHGFSLGLNPEGLRTVANSLFRRHDHLAEAEPEGATYPMSDPVGPTVEPVDVGPVLRALQRRGVDAEVVRRSLGLVVRHLGALAPRTTSWRRSKVTIKASFSFSTLAACHLGSDNRDVGRATPRRRVPPVRRRSGFAAACSRQPARAALLGARGAARALRPRPSLGNDGRTVAWKSHDVLVLAPAPAPVGSGCRCRHGGALRRVLVDALDDDLDAEVAALVFEAVAGSNTSDGHLGSVWTACHGGWAYGGVARRVPPHPPDREPTRRSGDHAIRPRRCRALRCAEAGHWRPTKRSLSRSRPGRHGAGVPAVSGCRCAAEKGVVVGSGVARIRTGAACSRPARAGPDLRRTCRSQSGDGPPEAVATGTAWRRSSCRWCHAGVGI